MNQRAVSLGVVLSLGLLLVPLAPKARASWIEKPAPTASIPTTGLSTLTNWGPTTSTFPAGTQDPFVIQQFNAATYQPAAPPGLTAQLQAIGISLSYTFQNTINMTFTNPSTSTVMATGNIELLAPSPTLNTGLTGISNVYVPGYNTPGSASTQALPILVNAPTFGNTATVTASSAVHTFPYTVTMATQTTSSVSALAYTQSLPTVLAAFTGVGSVQLPVTAYATSTFNNNFGNGQGGSTTFASVTVSVVYFYAYVPEPSSLVLTGLGGFGLLGACLRQRRRRQD